jgi:hypothetical protein
LKPLFQCLQIPARCSAGQSTELENEFSRMKYIWFDQPKIIFTLAQKLIVPCRKVGKGQRFVFWDSSEGAE